MFNQINSPNSRSVFHTHTIPSLLDLRRENIKDVIKIVVVGWLNLQVAFLAGSFTLASDTIDTLLQWIAQASSTTTTSSMTTTNSLLQMTTNNSTSATTFSVPDSEPYDPAMQILFAQILFVASVMLVTDALLQGGVKTALALVRNTYLKARESSESYRKEREEQAALISRSAVVKNLALVPSVNSVYGSANNYPLSIVGIFTPESVIDRGVTAKSVLSAAVYKSIRLIISAVFTVCANNFMTMELLNRQDEDDRYNIGNSSFFMKDAAFNWLTLHVAIALLEVAVNIPLSYITKSTGCCIRRSSHMGETAPRGNSATFNYNRSGIITSGADREGYDSNVGSVTEEPGGGPTSSYNSLN